MNTKRFAMTLVIIAVLVLAVVGYYKFTNEVATPTAQDSLETATTRNLSLDDVKNASYLLPGSDTSITLINGTYTYPGSPSAYVTLRSAAFGDLDGDGVGDAVVVLDNVPPPYRGLGGDYATLFAVINKQGKPVSSEKGIDFGDGTATSDLAISAGTISVFLQNPGFTFNNTTKRFVLKSGVLSEVLP